MCYGNLTLFGGLTFFKILTDEHQKLLGDGNIHRRPPWLELHACWDGRRPTLSLPGAECSSDDGRGPSRGPREARGGVEHTPRVVCGIQAYDNRPMATRRSSRLSPDDYHARGAVYRLAQRSGSDDTLQADKRHPCRAVSRTKRPRTARSPVILRGTCRVARGTQRAFQGVRVAGAAGVLAGACTTEGIDIWPTKAEGFFWCTSILTPSMTRNSTSGITPNICQNC